jgi:HAD superfamily hydrolase (TIGR01509 family)
LYIFDLDGTLLDSNGLWGEVDEEFLARRGLAATREYEDTVARFIFPTAAVYTREYYHLPDSPADIMAEWDALAARHYRDLAPLKAGAAELLAKCRAENVPAALFTACRPELCRMALERFGLTGYFQHVIYAEEIGLEKHDPACFIRLSELLGVSPAECTLFDDSPANCATARAAGMRVVGVYDDFYAGYRDRMRTLCDRYVNSLEELL